MRRGARLGARQAAPTPLRRPSSGWALRVQLLFALAVAVALPRSARAEPDWGVAAFDGERRFLGSYWPEDTRLSVGSDPECDLQLEGLASLHAELQREPDGVTVLPVGGEVEVNGAVLARGSVKVGAEDAVRIGPYQLQLYLPPREDRPQHEEGEVQAAAAKIQDARKQEFAKAAYQFCHDPDYGERGVVGRDLCVILDDVSVEVCPEAARCKAWKEATAAPPRFGRVGTGRGSGRSARRVQEPRPLFELPKVPPVVGYALLGVVLLALVGAFVFAVRKAGWESEEFPLDDAEISDAARKLQALPEARSQVLLRMAARALEVQDLAEAAILLHLAVLRHLDDEGLARYHPSKTNGDYLRAIRRHRDLAELFKQVALQTERLRFGDGAVEPGALAEAMARAPRVLGEHRGPSTRPEVAVGVALLALSGGLYGCPEAPGVQAYYDHGPAGLSALAPLLREAGLDVEVRRDRLLDLPANASVVVLRTSAAGRGPWPHELRLDALLDGGKSVVVVDDLGKSSFFLPSTASVAAARDPQAMTVRVDADPEAVSCAYPFVGLADRYAEAPIRLPQGRQILWDGNSQTSTISRHPLVMHPFLRYAGREDWRGHTAAHAWAVHRDDGEDDLPGCLFVFADRDLFTNASLTRRANADFVARFFTTLTPEHGKVVFADRLDQWTTSDADGPGEGEDGDQVDPTRALKASNMLPFVLQVLLLLALLYAHLGASFGPLRDRREQSHKHFVEHAEAIGRQYARTGQAGLTHAATALARFLVHRYRDQLRGGDAGGWAGLARHLASKHDLPEEDVRAALRLGIEGQSELGAPGPNDPTPASERMQLTLSRLLKGHRPEAGAKRRRG